MKTRIYLDNAATTKTSQEMLPVFTKWDKEVKKLLLLQEKILQKF